MEPVPGCNQPPAGQTASVMEASNLQHIRLDAYTTLSGVTQPIDLSYQLFGRPLHTAPVVLVNHALTGNSNVAGTEGWWSSLVGPGKCIDTDLYTVLCFNVPGNGYDGFLIENYKDLWRPILPKSF